jgi:hypothetical protein
MRHHRRPRSAETRRRGSSLEIRRSEGFILTQAIVRRGQHFPLKKPVIHIEDRTRLAINKNGDDQA